MQFSKLYYKHFSTSIIVAIIIVNIFASSLMLKPTLASDWWNTEWTYRKKITIDHTKVAADLTNFPVLIEVTDADLAAKAQDDGDDIVVTNADGTKLNHEIEFFDGASGHLVAWVCVPFLSSAADTVLYIYYGNPSAENQQNPEGVWVSDYRMVQHLEETGGTVYDSTAYGNHGTYYGTQQNAEGKIDGADGFIGNLGAAGGDYIDCGNDTSLNINQAITVSAWIKPEDQANYNHICTKGCDSPNRVYQLSIDQNEKVDFIINADSTNARAVSTVSVPIGQWSYVVGTYDRNYVKIYVNGVLSASKAYTNPININSVNLRIASRVMGTGNTGASGWTFDGSIDEVRVSAVSITAEWIQTEYNNQNSPSTFYKISAEETTSPPPPPAPWWDTNWQYRKKITIDHTKVAADLTDFPILIDVTDVDSASKAQNDGDDIAFILENGDKLDHEIEFFDGTLGKLVAWVRIPSLSSTADTVLYMYYGNPNAENQQNPEGVWVSDYRMVQHLEETGGTVYDSTAYGNHGTYYGTQQNAEGKIDGADGFIGNLGAAGGDYIDCGNDTSLNINQAITVSAWIKPNDQTQWNHICTKGCDIPNRVYQLSIETDERIDFIINGDNTNAMATTTMSVPIGQWSHVVGTYDRNYVRVYINGIERASKAYTNAINTNGVNLRIASRVYGTSNTGPSAYTFDGLIDEVRIAATAKSPAWIQTEYNNQNSPSTFYTVSAEETRPFIVQYVSPTPDDGATIYTTALTINVTSNFNLSSATLIWWKNPVEFKISIDETLQSKWGLRYPVTYVFNLPEGASNIEVFRRDSLSDDWKKLEEKTSSDFFNGIECVRFNYADKKAYVSVGFNSTNNIYLRFTNVLGVTFNSIAKYYDNRKATYTLSIDNWGKESSANPGAPWQGMTNDSSDKYQAAIHACRFFNLPVTVAINTHMAGGASMWQRAQEELNFEDNSWEPAVHTRTHPCSSSAYLVNGYDWEILGCKDDILGNLTKIPYGHYVFTFILPCGYEDNTLQSTSAGQFIFLRDWTGSSNPSSTNYALWNPTYQYYGIGGWETKSYDSVLQSLSPSGIFNENAVNELNSAFDIVYDNGGIFYAMFHPDRYQNSIIYNIEPNSSTLIEHFRHVANRKDVWYVANGWLYSYRMMAERASVQQLSSDPEYYPMNIHNEDENTFAYYTKVDLIPGETYHYKVECNDTLGRSVTTAERTVTVSSIIDVDLKVTRIQILNNGCSMYANDTYANGSTYYYPVEMTIQNTGSGNAGQFYVKLEIYWINGTLNEASKEILVQGLPAGTSIIVNFTDLFNPTHTGLYQLIATADSQENVIETDETNNVLTLDGVKVTLIGDINCDGTINIFDAVIVSLAWYSTPSSSHWNIKADINHDSEVNILDATRLSLNWGKEV